MFFELACLVLAGSLLYWILLAKESPPSYWKQHGIPAVDCTAAATNLEIFLGQKNVSDRDNHAYKVMTAENKKFCGILERPDSIILIRDLELVKKVMIKNFDHFVDRREFFPVAKKENILNKMLGFMRGDEWKGVRTSMSPTFTTGKIRRMNDLFNSIGREWVTMLKSKAKQSSSGSITIPMLTTANQYTVDVIGSAVFGLNTGTIQDPNAVFAKNVHRLSEVNMWDLLKLTLSPRYPRIFKMLGIEVFDQGAIDFLEQVVRQSLAARNNGTVPKKNDFQQILLEAQRGELKAVESDEIEQFEKDSELKGHGQGSVLMSDDVIVAQSILFFFAGFLTTSTVISFTTYVLAAYQDVQEKLRKSIGTIMRENGSVEYDDLAQHPYLEMVLQEVLRKHSAIFRLERECVREFHDPETGLYVPKGATVGIPIEAIHHDPTYWENPDKFDPEHFSPEQKAKRSPYAHLPFGLGPRSCIGMRFALIEAKAAIAHLVHNFKIEPTEKTPLPVRGMPAGLQQLTPKGLELKLTPIN